METSRNVPLNNLFPFANKDAVNSKSFAIGNNGLCSLECLIVTFMTLSMAISMPRSVLT